MRSEFPSRADTEQGLMASHPKVWRTQSREREGHGEGGFGSPSVVVKTQSKCQLPCVTQAAARWLSFSSLEKCINPLTHKEFGGSSSSLCVIGWAAFRDIADLSSLHVWFLKSTCLGFIDHRQPNLGSRPDLDKAFPMLSKHLLKSVDLQRALL